MLRSAFSAFAFAAVCSSPGLAADWVVDASGLTSPFTNIKQAMSVASAGDRILVQPGVYPAFQFFKGVTVLGLGASPAETRIARCDYHPLQPLVAYDSTLANCTLGSAAEEDAIALTGNELALGTLVLDSVVVDGAVFLRGGSTGFCLQLSNCSIVAQPGDGFSGEAMWFGGAGNRVDIHASSIIGWDAPEGPPSIAAIPAGVGLRLAPGTQARITDTVVRGGSGVGALVAGATAITGGNVALELLGGSVVTGGASGAAVQGGAGVAVGGSIVLGNAAVAGGAGAQAGNAFAQAQPTVLPFDPSIAVVPARDPIAGPFVVQSGELISFTTSTAPGSTVLLVGFALDCPPPSAPYFISLAAAPLLIIPGNTVAAVVPPPPGGAIEGVEVFVQAATAGPDGVLLSGVVATRMNLQ